ncbi:MAG TPA: transglycosylase domain-containing protein [Ohtaekwangia sp.]
MTAVTPPRTFLSKINSVLLLERKWFRKLVKVFWIFFFLAIIGVPVYIYLVQANPWNLFGGMPSLTAMQNPENDLSSEVISADGASLGRYFRFNRSQVTYDQLPPLLVNTLLISEDHRFYEHSGLDFWSYMRVIIGMATFNLQGGGSTLSQQTAKNLFSTRGDELQGKLAETSRALDLLISKTKEWIIAVNLERTFTKEEIIALYLNTVPFNNNAYGIKIAAQTYFGKRLQDLNQNEAALLVGMLQGTNRFNPIEFPERALDKRNDVLFKLYQHHSLTKAEYDSLSIIPLNLNFSVQNQNEGIATYFRSVLQAEVGAWCRENGYDLLESGLKIYTTIDSRLQLLAEEALTGHMRTLQRDFNTAWGNRNPWVDERGVEMKDFLQKKIQRTQLYARLVSQFKKHPDSVNIMLNRKKRMRVFTWKGDKDTLFSSMDSLRYYNRFLHAGMMAMNPQTGEVKAWVGGINHRYFKYDHVHQAKRQPGSTFKPLVYGKAIEDGFSPCQEFLDISPTINTGNGVIYHVPNSGGGYGDGTSYTMRQALAKSLNSITAQLMEQLKPDNVAAFAHRMGISSKLDPVYSLGLGTSDVSLDEMVAAYCTYVNLGTYTQPYYLTRIEDKYGNVIARFDVKTKQATNQETAYKMIYMLRGGVEEEGGTSRGLSNAVTVNNQVGGKTGTTDNASDGWYMGITHNLVTGVWVGGDERSIHFPSWGAGAATRSALPIFDRFMTSVYRHPEIGISKGQFRQPDEGLTTSLDCQTDDTSSDF